MGKGSGSCARPALTIDGPAMAERAMRHPYPEWEAETDIELLRMAVDEARSMPERLYLLHRIRALNPMPAAVGLLSDDELERVHQEIDRAQAGLDEERIAARSREGWPSRRAAINEVLGQEYSSQLELEALLGDPEWRLRPYDEQIDELEERLTIERRQLRTAIDEKTTIERTISELEREAGDVYERARLLEEAARERARARMFELAAERHPEQMDEILTVEERLKEERRIELIEEANEQLERARGPLERHLRALEQQRLSNAEPRWDRQSFGRDFRELVAADDGQVRAVFLEDSRFEDHLAYVEYRRVRRQTSAREVDLSYEQLIPRINRMIDEMELDQDELQTLVGESDEFCLEPMTFSSLAPSDEEVHPQICARIPTLWGRLGEAERAELTAAVTDAGSWSGGARKRLEWIDTGERRWALSAQVAETDEQALMSRLYARGARPTAHELELPSYPSRHQVVAGDRLTIELPDGVLVHYVPHRHLGNQAVERRVTRVRFEASEELDRATERLADEMLLPTQRWSADQMRRIERADGGSEVVPLEYIADSIDRIRAGGDRVMLVGPNEGNDFGWNYGEVKPGVWSRIGPATTYRRGLTNLRAALTGETFDVDGDASFGEALVEALDRRRYSDLLEPDAMAHLAERFASRSTETVLVPGGVAQRAPMSERGGFRIEGAAPHEALRLLRELDLASGPARHVPTELAYGGPARPGRVLPIRDEYVTGDAAVEMPSDSMVLHGLTGVASNDQALDRLDRLVASGGLKSIAERRRQGIGINSMSPLGDVASGIDVGVPCKIGSAANYGSHVFFGLRPEVLTRRDVWFAPQDFGAGDNRYEDYNAYAKRIGHERFYQSPAPAAREQHLRTGLGLDSNEVYFKHEIPWSDVDTLFVEEGIAARVADRVEQWRAEGSIPAGLRIQPFGREHGWVAEHVKARSRELADRG